MVACQPPQVDDGRLPTPTFRTVLVTFGGVLAGSAAPHAREDYLKTSARPIERTCPGLSHGPRRKAPDERRELGANVHAVQVNRYLGIFA